MRSARGRPAPFCEGLFPILGRGRREAGAAAASISIIIISVPVPCGGAAAPSSPSRRPAVRAQRCSGAGPGSGESRQPSPRRGAAARGGGGARSRAGTGLAAPRRAGRVRLSGCAPVRVRVSVLLRSETALLPPPLSLPGREAEAGARSEGAGLRLDLPLLEPLRDTADTPSHPRAWRGTRLSPTGLSCPVNGGRTPARQRAAPARGPGGAGGPRRPGRGPLRRRPGGTS